MLKMSEGIASIEAAKAASPNYLGNLEVVESLLRMYGGEYIIRQVRGEDRQEVIKWADQEMNRLVEVFAGKNPDYPGPSDWNEHGGIDRWIQSQLVSPDWPDDLEKTLRLTLIMFLNDCVALAKREKDMQPAEVMEESNAIVETYRNLLVGIPIMDSQTGVIEQPEPEPEA